VIASADGIGVVYFTYGLLTRSDLQAADQKLRALIEKNRAIRYVLVDHTAVTEEHIEVDAVRELAFGVRDYLDLIPEGLVAMAAPSASLFGLCRMWESLVFHPRLSTFVARNREAADEWLVSELASRGLPVERVGQPE
jgi:hypothetical protein